MVCILLRRGSSETFVPGESIVKDEYGYFLDKKQLIVGTDDKQGYQLIGPRASYKVRGLDEINALNLHWEGDFREGGFFVLKRKVGV